MKTLHICIALTTSVLLLAVTACGSPAAPVQAQGADAAAAAGTPASSIRTEAAVLQETTIMDPAGFDSPVIAATVQIPAGWRTQGGVGWDRSGDCVGNYIRLKWLAASEDGREAFEIMPGYSWQLQGTDIPMNPCPALPIRSVREFLEIVVQRYPDARVLEYRDRPDKQSEAPAAVPGMEAHTEAGEMLITYRRDGRIVREMLTTTLSISEYQGNIVIGSPAVYAQRAPEGDFDAALAERMIASVRAQPQWIAMVNQAGQAAANRIAQAQSVRIAAWHTSEMGRISARGAMERSRIAMQTSREVAQIYSDGWNRSQATDERIQRRTLEAIGGYNTYSNPADGGVVRESIEYDRVLRTDSGNFISTDDPGFNPAGTQELERVP